MNLPIELVLKIAVGIALVTVLGFTASNFLGDFSTQVIGWLP